MVTLSCDPDLTSHVYDISNVPSAMHLNVPSHNSYNRRSTSYMLCTFATQWNIHQHLLFTYFTLANSFRIPPIMCKEIGLAVVIVRLTVVPVPLVDLTHFPRALAPFHLSLLV